jgi:L-alanine-DL-glutamate epimerase-like enolase superfamily enzyme
VRNVFVRISGAGVDGYGEASPNAFYGETAEAVLAKIEGAAVAVAGLKIACVEDISEAWNALWPFVAPSRAAQCALDLALWDWLAKRRGVSVAELAIGEPPSPVKTFCTIGVSEPDELAEKVAELADFPMVKVKSDARADLTPVRWICEQLGAAANGASPPVTVAVDANCAWDAEDVPALSRELAACGVAFIEQPLPPAQHARMGILLGESQLPIMADESCVTAADVERMPGHFSGFNIKLVKCGGLTPALRMLKRGRELGLKTMVGCMLESSLLIAAGGVMAQQTDYADLDGAWLLGDDAFASDGHYGVEKGVLHLSQTPGFGVLPLPGVFD